MVRRWFVALALAIALAALSASAASAFPGRRHPSLTVTGTVTAPARYSTQALATTLPQSSFTVVRQTRRGPRTDTDTGVSLETLVNTAGPVLPATKNALLRVTVTVAGESGRRVTLALGELDPSFGDHAAYLALSVNGHALLAPELVVPQDSGGLRTIPFVSSVTVGVQNPTATTPPSPGALTIEIGSITRVLPAVQLAALPAETLQVSFVAGTAAQSHTEVGPTLDTVLRAAHVLPGLNTWVAALGVDGYVATVTPAEAWVGGRPLLVSLNEDGVPLAEPRLVVDGDLKGGRYVTGVVELVVGNPLRPGFPWWGR